MANPINADHWRERVKGPGKYEGEPAWAAFAWEEIVLNGCADFEHEIDGIEVSVVSLDAEVRAAFPDAPERAALYMRGDGFLMQADLSIVLRDVDAREDDDPDRKRVLETLRALLDKSAHHRDTLRALLKCSPADLDDRLREAREALETVMGDG